MNPDTLAGALEATWTRRADATALVFGERKMTYGELGAAIMSLAAW